MAKVFKIPTILLAICALSIPARPATDPFVGIWKFNRKLSDRKAQTETITRLGNNKFRFTYSDICSLEIGVVCGSEVTFEINADGTDQPRFPTTTWAITIKNPNIWEIVYKTSGAIIGTETLTISPDGKFLSSRYGSSVRRPDGSEVSSTSVLRRLSGASDFAGTWWIKDVSISNPHERSLKISAPVPGVLVVSYPNMTITFDGKWFPVQGDSDLPLSSMATAERMDAHFIRMASKVGTKLFSTTEWKVSLNNKVLRLTEHDADKKAPIVSVYDLQ